MFAIEMALVAGGVLVSLYSTLVLTDRGSRPDCVAVSVDRE